MNNYSYEITGFYYDAEVTIKTNSVNLAIEEFLKFKGEALRGHIIDGFTGEVLVSFVENTIDYVTELWEYAIKGYCFSKIED